MNHVSFQGHPPPLAPTNHQPQAVPPPRKLRRISRACDFCHKRSIRCKPSDEDPTRCQNCDDFDVPCTYLRPAKKRGIKSGSTRAASENGNSSRDGESDARMLLELTHGIQGNGFFNVVDRFSIPERWKTLVIENETKIQNLVDVYFEVVYPIFPLFHSPNMKRKVASRDYLTDHSFFADTMAICALASARARDGALFPGQWEPGHFHHPPSEVFFAAVKEAMPQDLSAMKGLDWMRTCALMALYGIQVGKIDIMHQYLGMYHSLVSMDSLHDEKNWPQDIGLIESELRRRLFWSMYTLEVYSSIVWGNIIRCREAQSHVQYPSEIDDEFFTDAGYHPPNSLVPSPQVAGNTICWLHGLNFCTELYRILEHAMDDFHRRRPVRNQFSPPALFNRETPQQSDVLNKVMSMYEELPPRFKETRLNLSHGQGGLEDKFSFQAANITATLQLVRMVLFTSKDATVDEKCAIARDLVESFNKIPIEFLRAISSPLLHHVAGIGAILGSAIEGPISEPSYHQIRVVLLQMVDLLSNLETGISRTVGAASRLRAQLANIDNYMNTQRRNDHTQSQLLLNNNFHPAGMVNVEPNPNIDPSLQDAFQTPPNPYDFSNVSTAAMTASMNVMAGHNLQLPPEILEGWPWPLDISQGFASSGLGQF
ncbi:uncharacterized protein LY89DRAFT_689616 [Mollisia scopiformis]|uniref:Zn(2)-C6 fungal-type domain-containing protein n=1 Tax=Mollisia scopiformis TaxID=149040 RepID=A0A132BF55_MOLSC|nr:uncharacterized protein LY89DRAFT_689616 [Mollisia scopiformis]KUJ10337.1 hypothetical protein LY89DRAFT_689616 [Mollisia scopiformis]